MINDNTDWMGAETQINASRGGSGRSTVVSVKMGIENGGVGKKRKTGEDGGNAGDGGRKNRRSKKIKR